MRSVFPTASRLAVAAPLLLLASPALAGVVYDGAIAPEDLVDARYTAGQDRLGHYLVLGESLAFDGMTVLGTGSSEQTGLSYEVEIYQLVAGNATQTPTYSFDISADTTYTGVSNYYEISAEFDEFTLGAGEWIFAVEGGFGLALGSTGTFYETDFVYASNWWSGTGASSLELTNSNISETPLPAGFGLLAAGLAGFGLLRRAKG